MHRAPSVSYPAGRSHNAQWLLWGIWFCGACCAAAACSLFDPLGWRAAVIASSVAAAGAATWRSTRRQGVTGELRFDGQQWAFAGVRRLRSAMIHVAIDFQSLLLVRLVQPRRAPLWLWVDRGAMPERWQDLRRAVYSRAPPAGLAADLRQTTPAAAHEPSP